MFAAWSANCFTVSTQTHKKQMKISGRQGNDADGRVWNTRKAAVWLESITERDHLVDRKLDGTK